MTVRTVLTWPDKRLLATAHPVEAVDAPIRALVDDMFETMYAEKGVGLAATQIGVPLEVVVMDCGKKDAPMPLALINPRIVEREGAIVWNEGCLSLPGVTAEVERAERVVVEYLDRDGQAMRMQASGLLAVCIQHELDHLDGQLYVDRLGKLERLSVLSDYERARSEPRRVAEGGEEAR